MKRSAQGDRHYHRQPGSGEGGVETPLTLHSTERRTSISPLRLGGRPHMTSLATTHQPTLPGGGRPHHHVSTSASPGLGVRLTDFGSIWTNPQARRCKKPPSQSGGARPPGGLRARSVFSQKVVQRRDIQHRLRQQLLQPPVLVLQRSQLLGVRHRQATVLGLPALEGLLADSVPAAHLRRRVPGLLLPQHADNLGIFEPTLLHVRLLR